MLTDASVTESENCVYSVHAPLTISLFVPMDNGNALLSDEEIVWHGGKIQIFFDLFALVSLFCRAGKHFENHGRIE